MDSKLTTKQVLFAEAYLGAAKGNGTQAARLAGYQGDATTLQSVGSANLKKPASAARVEQRVEQVAATTDEILIELSTIARAPWQDFVQIKMHRGEAIDVKINLADKLKALELLGKYRGMFSDKDAPPSDAPIRILQYLPPRI